MKSLMVICLIFCQNIANTCGWHVDDDRFYFYNIFDQTNISDLGYAPFLRDDLSLLYTGSLPVINRIQGNLDLYSKLLPNWSQDEIENALFHPHDENGRKAISENELQFKKYVDFANRISDFYSYRLGYSWDYDNLLKSDLDVDQLLQEGITSFENAENQQIRLRYAYQVIRIMHYSNEHLDAINFFEAYISDWPDKNEIYYYVLDQVAGCYFSNDQYERAAYLFLTVFDQSKDRKVSAYVSYSFCTDRGMEGKSLMSKTQDEAAYLFLSSFRSFSDSFSGLEKMIKLVPNDPKVEVMFMRLLNNQERKLWPTFLGFEEKELPDYENYDQTNVGRLIKICHDQSSSDGVENKDFWILCGSYLSFLDKDIQSAQNSLNLILDAKYGHQKTILESVYQVFSWQVMFDIDEEILAEILDEELFKIEPSQLTANYPQYQYLIMDHVAHLYYKRGNFAKAFLIHNDLSKLQKISDLNLLNQVTNLVQKKNKSSFEKMLMNRTVSSNLEFQPMDYLRHFEGMYHLEKGDFKEALALFKTSDLSKLKNEEVSVIKDIPKEIFSNNTIENYEAKADEIMTDGAFLRSEFNFISDEMTHEELVETIIEIEELAFRDDSYLSSIASYLLGNFYFNISNTGYYRGLLYGNTNGWNAQYFNYQEYRYEDSHLKPEGFYRTAENLISKNKGYNLLEIQDFRKRHYEEGERALEYYEDCLEVDFDDDEFRARVLYMMAKCELNMLYNEPALYNRYSGYDGHLNDQAADYKESFERLKENYSDTDFYREILEECSFFRYYTTF